MTAQQVEWRAVGLREAAEYLRGIAADYREMADRVELPSRSHFSYTAAFIRKQDYQTKASLLDGQAAQVETL